MVTAVDISSMTESISPSGIEVSTAIQPLLTSLVLELASPPKLLFSFRLKCEYLMQYYIRCLMPYYGFVYLRVLANINEMATTG